MGKNKTKSYPTLSKSDFKVALSCAKKLVYRKMGYPNNLNENEFMATLAEGGHKVGALANLIYPGVEITGNTSEALEQTASLLQRENITLHEAAIQSGQKLVRIDILIKNGNHFELIEVKSKSFNGNDDQASEKKDLEPYIEDAVFQRLVLQEVYPNTTIDTFLLMPDKSKGTAIEALASWFKVIPQIQNGTLKFTKPEVVFKFEGSPQYEEKRQMLLDDQLLKLMPLNDKVLEFEARIAEYADVFLDILNNDLECPQELYTINKDCKSCEFRGNEQDHRDGFNECWGARATPDPHVFDLYYGGTVGGTKSPLINELIVVGKTGLFDFQEEDFVKKDGTTGSRGTRQLIQYQNTRDDKEWFSDSLRGELEKCEYPLHFIDFETYAGAIPMHKGLRPYEMLSFQWSCHTVNHPGAKPIHKEWINTENSFPGFRFAKSLMEAIGGEGTPLMWATHENTALCGVLKQMAAMDYRNPELKNWLLRITKDKATDRPGRLLDMNAFTLRHYFHPSMKGKTSIKKTLPAVWNHHPYLHQIEWFKKYFQVSEDGHVIDPYEALKNIFAANTEEHILAGMELEEVVNEGSAAMKAYQDMLYGDAETREKLKRQLLSYCELDTMAMVMIWTHWNHSAPPVTE